MQPLSLVPNRRAAVAGRRAGAGARRMKPQKVVFPVINLLHRFAASESGVTAIEYALIAGFIVLAIYVVVGSIGTRLATDFYGPLASGFS